MTDTNQVDNLSLKQLRDNVIVRRFITSIRHTTHGHQESCRIILNIQLNCAQKLTTSTPSAAVKSMISQKSTELHQSYQGSFMWNSIQTFGHLTTNPALSVVNLSIFANITNYTTSVFKQILTQPNEKQCCAVVARCQVLSSNASTLPHRTW